MSFIKLDKLKIEVYKIIIFISLELIFLYICKYILLQNLLKKLRPI